MVIECAECGTRFRLPDDKLKSEGTRVRCSKCRHVFTVPPPASPAGEEVDFDSFNMEPVGAPEPPAAPAASSLAPSARAEEEPSAKEKAETAFSPGDAPPSTGLWQEFALGGSDEEEAKEEPSPPFTFGEEESAGEAAAFGFGPEEEEGASEFDFGRGEEAEETAFAFGAGEEEEQEVSGFSFDEEEEAAAEFAFGQGDETEEIAFAFGGGEEEEQQEPSGFSFDDADLSWDEDEEEPKKAGEFAFEAPPERDAAADFRFEEPAAASPALPAAAAAGLATAEPEARAPRHEERPPEMAGLRPAALPAAVGRRRRSPLSGILAFTVLLLLAVSGAAGYFYWQGGIPALSALVDRLTGQTPPVAAAGQIRIEGLTGFFVSNREAGQLFVIQGEAVNGYAKSRSAIAVKGVLYGKDGKPLLQQTAFCGNPLDAEALRQLPFARIEEQMNNQFGDSLSNLNVGAGKAIPFTIVFRSLPPEVAEFTVEPADSKPGTKP